MKKSLKKAHKELGYLAKNIREIIQVAQWIRTYWNGLNFEYVWIPHYKRSIRSIRSITSKNHLISSAFKFVFFFFRGAKPPNPLPPAPKSNYLLHD